jgi:hypothetical protein
VESPWLAVLLATSVAIGTCTWAFWSSNVGQLIFEKQRDQVLEVARTKLTESQFRIVASQVKPFGRLPLEIAVRRMSLQLVFPLLLALALQSVLKIVFLRPDIRYVRVLSVVSHAAVVWVVQEVLRLCLSYVREDYIDTLGVQRLLVDAGWPSGSERAAYVLAEVNPFIIWWIAIVTIGLAQAYDRSRRSVGLVISICYALAMVGLSLLRHS